MTSVVTRRTLLCGVAAVAAMPGLATAQPPPRAPRIGYLTFGPVSERGLGGAHDGFVKGLRDLGYVEGQNVVIEYRHGSGRVQNLPQAARELVNLKVDAILAYGFKDVDAVLQVSRTIPIVTVYVSDPVRLGYADSLARPGRNVTGLTTLAGDLTVKWLELLKQLQPKLARVGVLWDLGMGPAEMVDRAAWRPEEAFRSLDIARHMMPVRDPADLDPAFEAARREGAGALMFGPSTGVLRTQLSRIAALAIKHRWPTIADLPVYAEGGLLLAYGADIHDLFRRAATHVVKIVNGMSPAELPIEQPTKFTIVANLKTARALELVLPHSLLIRADRVIE